MKNIKIAVIGAKGMIGINLLRIIEEEDFKCELECFGKTSKSEVSFGEKTLLTKELNEFAPENYDIIFSAIEADLISPFKQRIKDSNAIWIDKSSATRMDEDVPLVVPEVNKEKLKGFKIVASPNCVVIPVAMFLHAIGIDEIEFVNITTYQSISGAGKEAMAAFFKEIKSSYINTVQKGMFYDHPMAFNVIPSIGDIDENGDCDEEIKIKQELRKIFNTNKTMQIVATTMRVPVTIGHLISLTFKTKKNLTHQNIIKKLENIGINYAQQICTPIMAAKEDAVFACRLRKNYEEKKGDVWSVILICDNLRKGGALNAWQIAKEMMNQTF